MTQPLSRWKLRIFALSWLSYFSYYFTRKNYSVIKSSLGLTSTQLSAIETTYLIAYCIGQFVNGAVADVVGPRRLIAAGMMLSAALAVLFGFSDSLPFFLLAYGLNGLAQASGWPGNGKLMAAWFGSRERGEIMGYWGTSYQLGGLGATTFATFLLAHWGWRAAWFGPAMWAAVVAIAVLWWVRDRPSQAGFADPDGALSASIDSTGRGDRAVRRRAWIQLLQSPMTWLLGANYFCMKLTRYSFIFWLPYYLENALGYHRSTAGYLSTSFDLGGSLGVVGAGLLADRVLGRRRIAVAALMTAMLVGALWLYSTLGERGPAANYVAMMLVGALLYGPDSLVSGAVAQDLGGARAAALACGVINGLGSFGAIVQGFLTDYVSRTYGWPALFALFQALAVIATLCLLPFLRIRPEVAKQQ